MIKISRNDPCHCGSGKKYKKCCLKHDDEERAKVRIEAEAKREAEIKAMTDYPRIPGSITSHGVLGVTEDEVEQLDQLSNGIIDLIECGQFDVAEEKCQALLTEFPEVVDGYDRFAMLYEARGDNAKAAEYYQKAHDFMVENGGYAQEFIDYTKEKVQELSN